jgi:cysteine desulfuration protein SufE
LIVNGCQSIVYLRSFLHDGHLFFQAESEALISSGLAYLLIAVYNGELPEVILKCLPVFIDELGISASLTPGRSNGLASIYLRMKQDAINSFSKGNI